MRTKIVGFDVQSAGTINTGSANTPAYVQLPSGVTLSNPNNTGAWMTGRTAGSNSFGAQDSSSIGANPYCNITRASLGSPAEIWVTFDWRQNQLNAVPAASPSNKIFDWGNVSVRIDSLINIGIYNNTTLVSTIVVPTLATAQWYFVKVHVKLDATTGLIEVEFGGNAMPAPYTNQNTVPTISLASATNVQILATINSTGSGAYSGRIDNIVFDDTAWPSGRPRVEGVSPSADNSLSGWVAVSPAATVTGGLTGSGKAEGQSAGSYALLDMADNADGTLQDVILGINSFAMSAMNMNVGVAKKLAMGIQLSGTDNLGSGGAAGQTPATTPSATNLASELFQKPSAGGNYTKTEFNSMLIKLAVA